MSCNLLKEANQNIKIIISNSNDSTKKERELLSQLLQLCLNCLQFDFIGTTGTDDTADDLSTVQIPTSWRSGKKRLFCRIFTHTHKHTSIC